MANTFSLVADLEPLAKQIVDFPFQLPISTIAPLVEISFARRYKRKASGMVRFPSTFSTTFLIS